MRFWTTRTPIVRVCSIGAILVLIAVSVPACATAFKSDEESEPSAHEIVWRAAHLVLKERGLAILSASVEEGRIVTAFASVDPSSMRQVALAERDQGIKWAGAEYRYVINLGRLGDRLRVSAKAEIRAWQREDQTGATMAKQVLQSNRALEQEFLRAFTSALQRVATE